MTSATSSYRAAAGRVIAALWMAAIVYVVVLQTIVGPRLRPSGVILEQIIFLLLWGAATPAIIWSAERFQIDRTTWLRRVPAHGLVAAVFIVALNVVAPTVAWLISGQTLAYSAVLRRGLAQLVAAFHLALIVYAFILGAGHYLRTLDVRRQEQLRAERLRADLATAQLRALTLQLQPHFLFNALNAVGALIVTDRKQEAFEVVGRLGELLRALLAIERRDEVSLREELELAESYVGIEQARLGDRLNVTWDVAANIGSAQVPPMTLQPLLENAIRHGVARSPAGGNLTIRAARDGTRLIFDVRDDGPGPAAGTPADAPGSGVGLANTRRRLGALYGDDHALELSRDGGWTHVRVELPYHVLATPTPSAVGAT
jgi:two-component system, LytTR family, sensor kinase